MSFDEKLCAVLDERVEAWLDGEVPEAEAEALAAHLRECPECAETLAWARVVRDELRALPRFAAPRRVSRAVLAETRLDEPSRRRLARWRAVAAAVVAGALLATGLFLGGLDSSRPASEVARAETEVRFALALLGQLQRRTADEVRDEVLETGLGGPLRRVQRSLATKGDG